MSMDDVPHSTDWLATPLACLAAVDAALRCQVCKDFYKTPMITSCSHTFCSLCIRRALSNDGKCPLCRAPEQEMKLRSNWSMEEAVAAFSTARPTALKVSRTSASSAPFSKRNLDEEPSSNYSPKRQRTSARLSSQRKTTASQSYCETSRPVDVVLASDEERSDDQNTPDSESADNQVSCPSCQKYMKAWQVFQHLEACPGPTADPAKDLTRSGGILEGQQSRQMKALERLPSLNYSILRDQALRKKLAELGISNQGPRNMLEKRHKEWVNLWNANCDSATPKKRAQLLHDLDVWEKSQGSRASTTGQAALSAAIKDKNFDGVAWAARHDLSFKDLIASARNSRSKTVNPPTDAGGQDAESQPLPAEMAPHPRELDNHAKIGKRAHSGLQETEGQLQSHLHNEIKDQQASPVLRAALTDHSETRLNPLCSTTSATEGGFK